MIPKVIHYCWFGGKPLPRTVQLCIDSWKKYCPDYDIIRWDESNFDVNSHHFMSQAYNEKSWAFVSDYARLKIVYENGGIYMDTDVELLKNIDFLLKEECYFGADQATHCIATGLGFGAVKENEIVEEMLHVYDSIEFDKIPDKNKIACPILNTEVLTNIGYSYSESVVKVKSATVFPPRYFDPLATGRTQNLLCDDTVSIHHYDASWTPLKQRLKRKLVRFVGAERILKIKERIK